MEYYIAEQAPPAGFHLECSGPERIGCKSGAPMACCYRKQADLAFSRCCEPDMAEGSRRHHNRNGKLKPAESAGHYHHHKGQRRFKVGALYRSCDKCSAINERPVSPIDFCHISQSPDLKDE